MYLFKVPLNPKPWRHRWDRKNLKGAVMPAMKRFEYEKFVKSHTDFKPHERWDMMKQYRESIHDTDQAEIAVDLKNYERDIKAKDEVQSASKKIVRTRTIPKSS